MIPPHDSHLWSKRFSDRARGPAPPAGFRHRNSSCSNRYGVALIHQIHAWPIRSWPHRQGVCPNDEGITKRLGTSPQAARVPMLRTGIETVSKGIGRVGWTMKPAGSSLSPTLRIWGTPVATRSPAGAQIILHCSVPAATVIHLPGKLHRCSGS